MNTNIHSLDGGPVKAPDELAPAGRAELDLQYAQALRQRDELEQALADLTLRRRAEAVASMDNVHAQEESQRALVGQLAAAELAVAQVGAELAAVRQELHAIRQTRTFRYAELVRRPYGWARGVAGRGRGSVGSDGGGPGTPASTAVAAPTTSGVGRNGAATGVRAGSYAEWVVMYDTLTDSDRAHLGRQVDGLADPPLVSVIMPVHDTPEPFLRAAIESVRGQLYQRWELCIADDCSSAPWVPGILSEYEARDERIRMVRRSQNGHISAASNSALELATGSWVVCVDHDDVLPEHALALVALALDGHPEAGLVYSDEDKLGVDGQRHSPYFKPDFDPLLLLGQNYLAHLCVLRRDLVEEVGGYRIGLEGSQDWDLALRVSERLSVEQVVHVPHVLYHWREHPGSTASGLAAKPYAATAGQRAVEDHLARQGTAGDVHPVPLLGWNRVRWHLPDEPPMVSIVIPTRDGIYLSRCIDSVRSLTTYPNYEIVVVDNGSMAMSVLQYLRDHEGSVRVMRDERPFNYSALNNAAVARSRGEVVCLLNDDTEVVSPDWLEELVGQVLQPGVGAAGAKLFFSDGRVQHAGVLLGVGGLATHAHRLADRLSGGYFGRLVLSQRFSAVTAACMVVRRDAWDEVGGLDDEHLSVSFNDVDLCLRLGEAGWAVVWTPSAELLHHESISRGSEDVAWDRHVSEVQYMKGRWWHKLQADPAYNPNLSLAGEGFDLAWPPRATYRAPGL